MTRRTFPSARRLPAAFSLIEVVAAIGIFAFGMVAVISLFAPVSKSVGGLADADAATNVANSLSSRLQARVQVLTHTTQVSLDPDQPATFLSTGQALAQVGALFKVATASNRHQLTDVDSTPNAPAADPRTDPQLLFASRDGQKFGAYNDPVWRNSDADKFFEIALMRNEAVSPPSGTATADDGTVTVTNPDLTATYLAYTARIRWPAFIPDSTNVRRAVPAGFNNGGGARFDNSIKQVLYVAGSIVP